MSFIRSKQIPPRTGNWYDYEVMTVHENGKSKQKVIRYIGRSGTGNRALTGGTYIPNHGIENTMPVATPKPTKLKVVCKFCGGQHTRKYGLYKGIQSYYCDDCHTKFTGTDALPR